VTETPPPPPPPDPQQPQQPPYGEVPPPPPPPPPYQQQAYQQPGFQQPGYGAPGYGAPGSGAPGYGQPAYYAAPNHESATTALILGILGLVVCPLVLSIPAWVIGRRAMNEIDASQGRIGGRGNAKAGYVLGIVGTAMGALSLLLVLVFALGGAFSTSFHTCTSVDENGVYNTNC